MKLNNFAKKAISVSLFAGAVLFSAQPFAADTGKTAGKEPTTIQECKTKHPDTMGKDYKDCVKKVEAMKKK